MLFMFKERSLCSNVSSQTDMHITNLELADNYLLAEGARYLLEMLKANFTIQHLVSLYEMVFRQLFVRR